MARLPLTLESKDYHRFLESFARDIAGSLADSLLDKKVPKETAHDIAATFLFNYAMMFDGGGTYKTEGKYKPQMGFSNGLGELIVPTSSTYLHELAYDIVEAAFNVEGRR